LASRFSRSGVACANLALPKSFAGAVIVKASKKAGMKVPASKRRFWRCI
jgi:hypothetical protein